MKRDVCIAPVPQGLAGCARADPALPGPSAWGMQVSGRRGGGRRGSARGPGRGRRDVIQGGRRRRCPPKKSGQRGLPAASSRKQQQRAGAGDPRSEVGVGWVPFGAAGDQGGVDVQDQAGRSRSSARAAVVLARSRRLESGQFPGRAAWLSAAAKCGRGRGWPAGAAGRRRGQAMGPRDVRLDRAAGRDRRWPVLRRGASP